jgi:hypothetical protein
MPGLSLDRLRDYRAGLRRRIKLLSGPMPPLAPDEARRQVEMLQQVLRVTQSEFDQLQREAALGTPAPRAAALVLATTPMSADFDALTAERRQVSFEKRQLQAALLRLVQDSLGRDVYDAERRQMIGDILGSLDGCNDDLRKLNPEIERLMKERVAAAARSAA